MLLEYSGFTKAAQLINQAYPKVIAVRPVAYDFARLMDNATEVSTSQFADALIERIEK